MFIVVLRYRHDDYSLQDKEDIAVLDTSDGTVELVSSDNIKLLGRNRVKNIQYRDGEPYWMIRDTLKAAINYILGSGIDTIKFVDGNFIFFDISVAYRDDSDRLAVDNKIIVARKTGAVWNLMYAFWYRGYVVIRFRRTGFYVTMNMSVWHTVVLDKAGNIYDHWGSSPESAFGIQLDLVSEV